jgi:ATP-dependent helicase/nuclease subunit A
MHARRISHPQEAPPAPAKAKEKTAEDAIRKPLPAWALRPPAAEPAPAVPLAPSKPGEDEPAAKGPLAEDQGWKFRRGLIVHHILEVLPQLPSGKRAAALAAWLARPALQMPQDEQQALAREIAAVLEHPEFAPIFGPASRAEVPLVGLAGGNAAASKILSGQIDRLCVTEDSVLVVDYKTNRPPPATPQGVARVYLRQMAAYRDVLRKVYPGREVRCALLWTDGPRLMPLPQELLDPHAP